MFSLQRLRSASQVALLHLGISLVVASVVAALVFLVWYPHPYDKVIQGRELFMLLLGVDLICGPLLTLILYDPRKAKYKWRIDVALIVFIQCAALGYGMTRMAGSRAVFLAFEGDRFRVVQADDVAMERLDLAPPELTHLGYGRPRLIGTRLLQPTDPTFANSIQMAMQGLHPAFRPERWVTYSSVRAEVLQALKPIEELRARYPSRQDLFVTLLSDSSHGEEALGYLPLVRDETTDWVVVVRRQDSQPLAYLQLDGW